MAKDQVEEVKSKIDIVELIGRSVSLKKAGRHYKGLCPFHSEKSPSFIVSPERQSYKCFGCGEGGDVYSFLEKYEGMSFLEALETLAKQAGVELESYRPTAADSQKKKMLAIMSAASEYYQYLLTKHAVGGEAREYLKERKIVGESIKRYGLGYAPNQWQGVSDYLVKKRGYKYEELEMVGLVIKSESGRYYDRFRGRVMFPLRDHKGSIVGFSGRILSKDKKEAKYINSPETSIYHKSRMLYGLWENKEQIRKEDRIILVEGELDMIPSVQAGIGSVVAIKGSAFTEEMARLIMRYTRNVIMALDADEAGIEAVKRAVRVAEPHDISVRVAQIVGGKDPGEVASSDPKKWRELVKGAVLYWDFLIGRACEGSDLESGAGARKVSQEVLPELTKISNAVVRAHYVTLLSKKLGVPEESIYEEMERMSKKSELSNLKEVVKKIEKGGGKSRRERVEEYLLALSLQNYVKLGELLGKVEQKWFEVPVIGKVMIELQDYKGEWGIKRFAGKLPSELQEIIDQTYLMDLAEIKDVKREWGKTMREVEELYLRDELSQLSKQIKKYENQGEDDKIEKMQKEFASISKKISGLG